MNGQNCINAQFCRADFYYQLATALKQCGGRHDKTAIDDLQQMSLWQVVDLLAQNGIRMTYSPEWHLNSWLVPSVPVHP